MGKQRRRRRGLIPWLGQVLLAVGRWLVRHPQPLIFLGVLSGLLWALWSGARHAEAFRITSVQVPRGSSWKLPESLIGANLWEVDIRALAEDLKRQAPWLKQVRVIRRPPNVISIDTIPRQPVAQVQIQQWHAVDRDGFILPHASAEGTDGLIRLSGVSRRQEPLTIGAVNTSERLHTALRVLETLKRSRALTSHRLTEIDVADVRQIRFVIDGDTDVRCGTLDELATHLKRLEVVLRVMARRQLAVRSIDVRFEEPVVEPRT